MTDILSWSQYQQEGGKLTYHQWIQCLIDSENITKQLGSKAIEVYDQGDMILSLEHQMKAEKYRKRVLSKLNGVI